LRSYLSDRRIPYIAREHELRSIDLTAARIWGIVRELAASGPVVPGDKGCLGEDDIRTPTGDGTSPRPRRTPTARTPGCGPRANAPTPSSSPGASCASSTAAPGAPGSWPKRSTFFRHAKPKDEGRSVTPAAWSLSPAGGVYRSPAACEVDWPNVFRQLLRSSAFEPGLRRRMNVFPTPWTV